MTKASCLPWLIFKLDQEYYAINSSAIRAIVEMPETLTIMHNVPNYVQGMMNFRDHVIPLLNLRVLLNMTSLEAEYEDFKAMIDARKNDHIEWVAALENTVKTNAEFTLTTDPHKCALGQWYDNFTSDQQSINFYLSKLDTPHKDLHAAALEVKQAAQLADPDLRADAASVALQKAKEIFMPAVINLLDGAKDIFKQNYKDMLIVLEHNNVQLGIVVDSVVAVDQLELADSDESLGGVIGANSISAVGKGSKIDQLILMMDYKALFKLLNNKNVFDLSTSITAP